MQWNNIHSLKGKKKKSKPKLPFKCKDKIRIISRYKYSKTSHEECL